MLHKVLGQIDFGTLDSGERSLPFGLLVKSVWAGNQNLGHLEITERIFETEITFKLSMII